MHSGYLDIADPDEASVEINAPLQQNLFDTTDEFHLSQKLSWALADDIARGLESAKAAILLCICSNLRYWHFSCSRVRIDYTQVCWMLKESRDSKAFSRHSTPLRHLEGLSLKTDGDFPLHASALLLS